MRTRTVLTLSVLPLLLGGLAACGDDAAAESSTFAVADGVREQYEVLDEEIEEKGQTVESGEWTIHLITEAAEPWFEVHGGPAEHRAPQEGETNHVEIIPVETATGRIVPAVPITLEVVDETGETVQKMDLEFYYSTFFHYANNFSIPESGSYTVRATVGVPEFNRHGEEDETPALTEGATVEFEDVHLGAE